MNATILYKTVANNRIIYYWLKHSLFMTDNRESSSSYEPPLVADQSGVGSIENTGPLATPPQGGSLTSRPPVLWKWNDVWKWNDSSDNFAA